MQNKYKGAREVAKPQIKNIPSVAPRVEMRIQVVTWRRSIIMPMNMVPKTEAILMDMMVNAEPKEEEWSCCCAKEGI